MRWTVHQEEVLRAYGSLGAKACRDIIHRRFGVFRSVSATERHAYRIGASVFRYETCPRCGERVRRLMYTGYCKACHYKHLAELHSNANREIVRREYEDDFTVSKREYDKIRKQSNRAKVSV